LYIVSNFSATLWLLFGAHIQNSYNAVNEEWNMCNLNILSSWYPLKFKKQKQKEKKNILQQHIVHFPRRFCELHTCILKAQCWFIIGLFSSRCSSTTVTAIQQERGMRAKNRIAPEKFCRLVCVVGVVLWSQIHVPQLMDPCIRPMLTARSECATSPDKLQLTLGVKNTMSCWTELEVNWVRFIVRLKTKLRVGTVLNSMKFSKGKHQVIN